MYNILFTNRRTESIFNFITSFYNYELLETIKNIVSSTYWNFIFTYKGEFIDIDSDTVIHDIYLEEYIDDKDGFINMLLSFGSDEFELDVADEIGKLDEFLNCIKLNKK